MIRRYFTVGVHDYQRQYAHVSGTSLEAVRSALHAAVDIWVDETLTPAVRDESIPAGELRRAVSELRIEAQ